MQVGAPGRDVQDRDRVIGHRVADRDAGADPLVEKPRHQCSGPLISTGSGRFERRAHPVRPRRPFRPARPRRHVALARAAQRLLVALDGQDATRAVGDGDDAAERSRPRSRSTPRHRRAGRTRSRARACARRRTRPARTRRGPDQTRVDVVLLATAIPRRGHFGSDPPHAVVASEKALARCGHRLVPLRVAPAMTPRGLAHRCLRTNGRGPRQGASSDTARLGWGRSPLRLEAGRVGGRCPPRRTAIRRGDVQGLHGGDHPGPRFAHGRLAVTQAPVHRWLASEESENVIRRPDAPPQANGPKGRLLLAELSC